MDRMTKPTILLQWGYNRPNWVKFFEEMKDDFHFVYLNHIHKDSESISFTNCRKVYWSDFKNVNGILDNINPVKVIFMGIDGPLAILLNNACRQRGILTVFIQHGIFHPYAAYLEEEILEKQSNKVKISSTTHSVDRSLPASADKFGIRFILSSVSLFNINAVATILQLKFLRKFFGSQQKALYYTKHTSRIADKYIVYTRFCSSMLKERDGIKDEFIVEVGNPEADEIIKYLEEDSIRIDNGYYLLIDDPLGEVPEYSTSGFISSASVATFHMKLNEYALSKGKKLKIKLHPYSYDSNFFVQHENICYIKDTNIPELIKNSDAVFGILSTLLIPVLYKKPCCLFKFNDKYELHRFLESIDYCRVLDYVDFSTNEISFYEFVSEQQRTAFIKAYLYNTDKQSVNRIKAFLLAGNQNN